MQSASPILVALARSENRRGFRSFKCHDGAETGAVGYAAVRRQEIALLGAEAEDMNIGHPSLFELCLVSRREVEEKAFAFARAHKAPIELGGDLNANLVAATADPGPDAGPNVLGSRPVFVVHRLNRSFRNARCSAAPTCVSEPRGPFHRVPQKDRVAVGKRREQGHTTL